MKPDAIYTFGQSETAHTRYILMKHRGADVREFPAVYVRGSMAGKKYVGFRSTVQNLPGHRSFSHTIELDKGRTVTGLNLVPEYPRKAYGDYNGDGLLIEFSEDWKNITMYFFRGMSKQSASLFQKWTADADELALTVDADALPLPLETKKADELF
jgi:hypothetical protein